MAGAPRADAGDDAVRRAEPEHLVVGHITKAHGMKGDLFVWPLTDRPESVFATGAELTAGDVEGRLGAGPEAVVVEGSRPFKRGLLLKFEGVAERFAAERLVGRYLLVPVSELEPLGEGEVFYHQLLGLEVVTADGNSIGRVREIFETEPAHLLEVRSEGRVHLIPFTERVVREVDVDGGRVVIRPPPGLLEL